MEKLQIEEILMKDDLFMRNILGIHHSTLNVPNKKYPQVVMENTSLVKAADWMKECLLAPRIIDRFSGRFDEGDKVRNKWHMELIKKYELLGIGKEVNEFLTNNKLKGNMYGKNFISASGLIDFFLGESRPELRDEINESMILVQGMGTAFRNYNQLSVGQKVRFSKRMDRGVYNILMKLYDD